MAAYEPQTICHQLNLQVAQQALANLERDQAFRLEHPLVAPEVSLPNCRDYPAFAIERFLADCGQQGDATDKDDDQDAINRQLEMEMSSLVDATAGMTLLNGKQPAACSADENVPPSGAFPNSSSSVHTLRYYGNTDGTTTPPISTTAPFSMLAVLPEENQAQQSAVPEFKIFSVNLCDLPPNDVSQIEEKLKTCPALSQMARIVGRTIPSPLSPSPTGGSQSRFPLGEITNNGQVSFRSVNFQPPSPPDSSSGSDEVDATGQLEICPSTVFKWVRTTMQHEIPTSVDQLAEYAENLEALYLLISALRGALGGNRNHLGSVYLREAIASGRAPRLLDLCFDGYDTPEQWGREFIAAGTDVYHGPCGETVDETKALLRERVVSLVLTEWVVIAGSVLQALASEVGSRV